MEQTYRASDFGQAMARVKRELGPDAVILSTRQIARGDVGGRGQLVEVRAVSKEEATEQGILRADGQMPPMLERRLKHAGVPAPVAASLARQVLSMHGGDPPDLVALRDALGTALAREMIFAGPAGSGARAIAMVGPTGVGKTTTIAKLAAHGALIHGRRVGLVSIDQYRIGGTEQLQRYADLIGIPLEVADDARTLEVSLRRLSDAEVVFIDTAGRSPKDAHALAQMAECLHGVQEPVEVHLCVPASMRDRELAIAIERHSVLRPVRLNSTKVDEAVYRGAIVDAHARSGLPLAYFTTGQCVPEDIELATPERLAALLSREEDHR